MIRTAKIDANHKEIVEKLRKYPDISVANVFQLKNFCDIIVGYENKNYLFEIKVNSKKKLTEGEAKFHKYWHGQVNAISSYLEILKIINYEEPF